MQLEITPEYLASQQLSKTFPERFWTKVQKSEGCWIWGGATTHNGYGTIQAGGRGEKLIRAHRASWILNRGPIPEGLCVLHICDNPPCVNPAHLWIGTLKDNTDDMVAKGRCADEIPLNAGEGHPLAKLTWEKVREIRSRYSREAKNGNVLGREFGVTGTQIYNIVNHRTWK